MKTRAKINISIISILLTFLFTTSLKAQPDTLRTQIDSLYIPSDSSRLDTLKVIERTTIIKDNTNNNGNGKDETEDPLRRGEFGIRFLPTFTSLSFNTSEGGVVEGSGDLNYGYGVMFGLNFSKNVGLVAEIDYLDISQKYKDRELERQVHLNYLNIPVLLSLNTNKTKPVNLNVVIGPQFGINVGSSVSTTDNNNGNTVHATLAVKEGDVGIVYGAGFEFALNRRHTFRLDLGFRGMYGLVDISSDVTGPNTYNVLIHASRRSYGGCLGLTLAF